MAKLPQMTYVVGKEKVACPKAAASMAKASGDAVHFAVGDKKFDDESKAKLALVEATEHFVASFSKPKVCSQSGKVTVAGHEACCEGTAAKMAAKAASAMDSVSMTYLVGDKACACPKEAAKLAQDSGDIQLFVVGEDKTACDVTARLSLARAKYRAAIVALMQASSDTTQASSETKETSKES